MTGLCYAGTAIGVIAAVAVTAAVIYKCRCNIEKTYKITAELDTKFFKLTADEIYNKLANIVSIPFELKIRHGILTQCQEYVLRMEDPYDEKDILISDSTCNNDRKLLSIEGGAYTGVGGRDLKLNSGEIVPSPDPVELTRITTKNRIEALEITSEQQEDTEFLNKLIKIDAKLI